MMDFHLDWILNYETVPLDAVIVLTVSPEDRPCTYETKARFWKS